MSDILFGRENSGLQLGINQGSVHYHTPGRPETTPHPLSTVPFSRDPDFVERGGLLDDIRDKISSPGARIALVGLGGAGNGPRVEQGFQRLADRVKIHGRQNEDANIFRLVYNWLCDENNGPWVLILDNLDVDDHLRQALRFRSPTTLSDAHLDDQPSGHTQDEASGETMLQFLPRAPHGRILITTRNLGVATGLVGGADIVNVGSMNSSQATALMRASLGNQYTQEGIQRLCEALEFMPLAIVQAGAYIRKRAPRCSVLQYLHDFQKNDHRRTRLLKHEDKGLQRDEQSSNSILITWQISFEYIRRIRSSATDLLSLMSFFDHQGIVENALRSKSVEKRTTNLNAEHQTPEPDYMRDTSNDEAQAASDEDFDAHYEFEEDILLLRDFSLISKSQDPHTFQMHALVQLATRFWLDVHGQASRWQDQFIQNISREFGESQEDYENIEKRQVLFPHVKFALDRRPESPQGLERWASLMHWGASYALGKGNLRDGLEMISKAIEVRERILGLQDNNTLESFNLMAHILIIEGRFEDGESILEESLKQSELAGREDRTRIKIMSSLGDLYFLTDRLQEAEILFEKILEAASNGPCASKRDSINFMTRLAMSYCDQHRYSEGEELISRAIRISKEEFGEAHPETLSPMLVMADFHFSQGRYQEAATLQEQVLNSEKVLFGNEYLRTNSLMELLGRTYERQYRFSEAEELYIQCRLGLQKLLGDGHIRSLRTSDLLMNLFMLQDRLQDAILILKESLESSRKAFGEQHRFTIEYLVRIGHAYWKLSQPKEAEPFFARAQERLQRSPGEMNYLRLRALSALAFIYEEEETFSESERLWAIALEIAKEMFGERDLISLKIMERLANRHTRQGRFHEAEQLLSEILFKGGSWA